MGGTMMGGQQGQTNLLTPEQQKFLGDALGGEGQIGQAFGQFLQPQNYEEMFQKSVVDPTVKAHEQQVIPGLQQRFVDAGAGSSSALNQALSQSATDLSSSLGTQRMNFMQGQQQNTLGALGQLGGMAGQHTFQPYQQEGMLPGILQGLFGLGKGSLQGGGSMGMGTLARFFGGGK